MGCRFRTQPLPTGAVHIRALASVHGAAIEQERSRATRFRVALTGVPAGEKRAGSPALAGGVAKIWLDGKVRAALADTTAQIGAPPPETPGPDMESVGAPGSAYA